MVEQLGSLLNLVTSFLGMQTTVLPPLGLSPMSLGRPGDNEAEGPAETVLRPACWPVSLPSSWYKAFSQHVCAV